MTRRTSQPTVACSIEGCENIYFDNGGSGSFCNYHRKKRDVFQSRGFTTEKYIELMSVENCDLCGKPMKTRNMDHDHNHCPSGKWCVKCVRGVVCSRCNSLLAGLDDIEWKRHAEKYLKLYALRDIGETR